MLAVYVCMDVLLCNVEMSGQAVTKTCSIQKCTGSDDLVLRKSGNLCKYISQYVNRVAYDNVLRIRRRFHDLRCDRLDNVDICLRKLDPCLARLTCDTGCDDHDIGILCILIASCDDGDRASEAGALLDVHYFALDLVIVNIDHDDLGYEFFIGKFVRDCCADASCADDCDFAAHCFFLCLSFFYFFY